MVLVLLMVPELVLVTSSPCIVAVVGNIVASYTYRTSNDGIVFL
jgi:hypothetical protein